MRNFLPPTVRCFHSSFAVSRKVRQSRHEGSGGVSSSSLRTMLALSVR